MCNSMQATDKALVMTRTSRPGVASRSELHNELIVQPKLAPWSPPIRIKLASKPWSLLSLGNAILVGASNPSSLTSHTMSSSDVRLTREYFVNAQVYALCPGTSPQCFVAGSYDGQVSLFDARSPSKTPRLVFADRFSDEPIYSVTLNQNRIIAGGARHSSLRCFDARSREGWTTFVGKEDSPVYSVVAEGRFVWAATERSANVVEWSEYSNMMTWDHDR